jgi:hypothetical protein
MALKFDAENADGRSTHPSELMYCSPTGRGASGLTQVLGVRGGWDGPFGADG